MPDSVNTVVCAPDDGWRYHPKHLEQFPEINKLCNVASSWIYVYQNILTMHGPLNVKFKRSGFEVDPSAAPSAEVKKYSNYSSTFRLYLHDVGREKFSFLNTVLPFISRSTI